MPLLSRPNHLSSSRPTTAPSFLPNPMAHPPALPAHTDVPPPTTRFTLLINPFYPKDPQASFGKHVLTPTLALTSIAGATPRDWEVRYWDENLLQGPPPSIRFLRSSASPST